MAAGSGRFSIVIPAYNRGEYLRQALASCLAQTTSDFEVIVSDDCSAEDLQSVAASFGDARIKYSKSEIRLGAAKNHQRAADNEVVNCLALFHLPFIP